MKNLWFSALAGMVVLGVMSPMVQATQVKDMDTALKKASDDGIMVFLYGVGWDKYSEKRCTEIMGDKYFKKARGRAVYLTYPCIENPTEEQKKMLSAILCDKSIPFPKTYPAIIWLDKQGRTICTIQGEELCRASTKEVAELILNRLNTIKEMVALEKKAEKASGVERAKFLGDARTLPGIDPPDKAYLAEIAKADPHDESGYVNYFSMGEYDISAKVLAMKYNEAILFAESVINSKSYSPLAKQTALIAMLGQWRTQGSREQLPRMRELAQEVIKINADNYHAGSARYMIDYWFKPFTLENGWFPAVIPKDATPMVLEGEIPIKNAGTYEVVFQFTNGRYALTISAVRLYDGDTQVAEDVHVGSTGDKNKNNIYSLELKKPVKNPRLEIVVNQGEKTATQGMITVRKAKK